MMRLMVLDNCTFLFRLQNLGTCIVQRVRRENQQVAIGNGGARVSLAFSFSAFWC